MTFDTCRRPTVGKVDTGELRPRIAARLAEAEQRAAELEALILQLRGAVDHLDALTGRHAQCGPECGLLLASGKTWPGIP